jgi:hypothetical protein
MCDVALQFGYPSAIAASGEHIRSNAVTVAATPFKFSLVKSAAEYSALKHLVNANSQLRPNWFSPFDKSADSHHGDVDDDDYSIDGWGFAASAAQALSQSAPPPSTSAAADGGMNIHAPLAAAGQRGVVAAAPDDPAARRVARMHRDSDGRLQHGDQIKWHKDTPNFKQVQGFVLLIFR